MEGIDQLKTWATLAKRKNTLVYRSGRKFGEVQIRSKYWGEERKLLPLPAMKHATLSVSVHT
jgi:hypothetical protein